MVSSVGGVSSNSAAIREIRTTMRSSELRWVLLRDEGLALPDRWDAECVVGDYDVKLSVAVDHGRLACEQAVVTRRPDGAPITSASLRQLPIARVMTDSAFFLNVTVEDSGFVSLEPFTDSDDPNVRRAMAEQQGRLLDRMTRRQGRPRSGDRETLLRQVVNAYREAVAMDHNAPRKVAAARLGYSSGYVGRLLVEARKKGLLGLANPGRSGER